MKIFLLVILLIIPMLSTSASSAGVSIPKEVQAKIKAKAATDFPGDHSKQREVIKTQSNAYNEVESYKNEDIPERELKKIKKDAARNHPVNYRTQLFVINLQVNSYIGLGLISSRSPGAGIVACEKLRWKLSRRGRPATYRGTLKAGSVDVIYVEVRNNAGLIGQGMGFPNPSGTWEIVVWGDYNIKNKHREWFYCENLNPRPPGDE